MAVSQLDTPDLVVTSLQTPTTAEEGTPIDVTWTVQNQGLGTASGIWVDRVYLQEAGHPDAPIVELGRFYENGPVAPGTTYTRTEQVTLPVHINDLYTVYVTTDLADDDHPFGTIYEGGDALEENNTTGSLVPLAVSAKPRPDLQVADIEIPDHVPAGSALSVTFDVINQGTVGTEVPHWIDQVYLSLDTTIDPGSLLIGELANQSALGPGEQYRSTTDPIVVPERFRGDVYVIVSVDAKREVDQWPNGSYNLVYKAIHVDPLPLPDLVVSDVIVPTQVTAGAVMPVTYTVTNLGAGATLVDNWTETIWLTQTPGRPNPNHGDVLLKTISHTGGLVVHAGYDQTVNVQIPAELDSGTFYVTPWVDPYGVVLQDQLATNVNPDDPAQLLSENYKNQSILILGALPDLVVTNVNAPATLDGGSTVTVTWTVKNAGIADAVKGGWGDRVYLSDNPDPKAEGAKTFYLGEVKHDDPLVEGASYTESLTVTLSPSAQGLYWVVLANDSVSPPLGLGIPGVTPPPNLADRFTPLKEVDTDNNGRALDTVVTPVPANLKITNVSIPDVNYSGESMTIQYTVINIGSYPVWPGTDSWTDFLWLTADPTFIRSRASYLGQVATPRTGPLNPGDGYVATITVKLPEGTSGHNYLWIDLDAHNDLTPLFFPNESRQELTGWYPGAPPNDTDPLGELVSQGPVDSGDNESLVGFFSHWAYEDPTDNRTRVDVPITFREADLQITDLEVPSDVHSGETIDVTYTVTNMGDRDTRVNNWVDRIFLSHDASLDNNDTKLSDSPHSGVLKAGDSYTRTIQVKVPDDIDGDFHLIVYADSAADTDSLGHPSDVGFNRIGLEFKTPSPLAPFNLVSFATRNLARGKVSEYQQEGNNLGIVDMPVTLTPPPDLQVNDPIIVPTRANVGQQIDVSFTVTNAGGDTVAGQEKWNDLIYLSRDKNLDLKADRYLGMVERTDPLGAGESYTIDTTVDLPPDMVGPYYVFVVTDAPLKAAQGMVYESNERNNDRASDVPLVIEQPPASDLQVTAVVTPLSATIGAR